MGPMAVEEWRPIPTWEGYYEVSSLGRYRRIKTSGNSRAGRVLTGAINHDGYVRINLRNCGRREAMSLHIVVAAVFLGPCPNGCEVNHRNGKKLDNRAENLEYLTHHDNMLHAVQTGLMARGERSGKTKMTTEKVIRLRERFASGEGLKELAAEYGISRVSARMIVIRKHWGHV